MVNLPVITLPAEFYSPSFLGGGGANYGLPRQGLPPLSLHRAKNVWASPLGIGNQTQNYEGIGVNEKLNETTPTVSKIQAQIIFNGEQLFIANGNVYKMDINGGAVTTVALGVFSATSNIYYQFGRGGTPKKDKVYICDDDATNNPYNWDGTSLTEMIVFNGDILGLTLPKPVLMASEHGSFNERVVWGFPSDSEFKDALLFSQQDNGDVYTSTGSIIGAFLDTVAPMNGGHIIGFNNLTASEQASEIATTLFVCKSNGQTYRTGSPKLVNSEVVSEFNITGVNLGTINGKTLIGFSNDLISIDTNGIGTFSFATDSGQIEARVNQLGVQVNSLIQQSYNQAKNNLISNAFALHCPARQAIWFFMPSPKSSATLNGWAYPEAPNDLIIQYQYGLTGKDGNETTFWSVWENEGWAWSSAVCVDDRVFLGSYFGDVYEWFTGDSAEANPLDPLARISLKSVIETGDLDFGDLTKYKKANQLWWHWNIVGSVLFNMTIYYNSSENGQTYSGLGANVPVSKWDVAKWDVAKWAGLSSFDLRATPVGGGKQMRFKVEWNSLANSTSNRASLYGLSGVLELGDNALKYRK